MVHRSAWITAAFQKEIDMSKHVVKKDIANIIYAQMLLIITIDGK